MTPLEQHDKEAVGVLRGYLLRNLRKEKNLVPLLLTLLHERDRVIAEMIGENCRRMLKLYNNHIPYVLFDGKATEHEKVAIYKQAIDDVRRLLLSHDEQPKNLTTQE